MHVDKAKGAKKPSSSDAEKATLQYTAHLAAIGNSKGIRLNKSILKMCGITDEVSIEASKSQIVIRPISSPREGWADMFREANEKAELLMSDFPNQFDDEEWSW